MAVPSISGLGRSHYALPSCLSPHAFGHYIEPAFKDAPGDAITRRNPPPQVIPIHGIPMTIEDKIALQRDVHHIASNVAPLLGVDVIRVNGEHGATILFQPWRMLSIEGQELDVSLNPSILDNAGVRVDARGVALCG